MNKSKLLNMLGFAMKSRNLISGNALIYNSLGKKHIYVVLIGSDTSQKSVEKLKRKCRGLNIPIYEVLTIDELSRSIGKYNRTVIGICDKHFSDSIINLISDMGI